MNKHNPVKNTEHLQTIVSSGFDVNHSSLEIVALMAESWYHFDKRYDVNTNACCYFHQQAFNHLSHDPEAIDYRKVKIPLNTHLQSGKTEEPSQKQSVSNTQNDSKQSDDSFTTEETIPEVESTSQTNNSRILTQSNPKPIVSTSLNSNSWTAPTSNNKKTKYQEPIDDNTKPPVSLDSSLEQPAKKKLRFKDTLQI